MAVQFPIKRVELPSKFDPRKIVTRAQPSGFMKMFPDEQPKVLLDEGTMKVYVEAIDIQNIARSGQTRANLMSTVSLRPSFAGMPTYQLQMRAAYARTDLVGSENWGVPLVDAYRIGMFQGIFQAIRDMAFSGPNPQNGEGLLESPATTRTNLPADSAGNTTAKAYRPAEMAQYLMDIINDIRTKINVVGDVNIEESPVRITIVAPQRLIANWDGTYIPLGEYQKPNGGIATITQAVKLTQATNGTIVTFTADDKLAGAGEAGSDGQATDLVVVTCPQLPGGSNAMKAFDTNIFGDSFNPANDDINALYADRSLPSDAMAPIDAENTDFISWMRVTPGWALRPEGTTVVSMPSGGAIVGITPPILNAM